MKRNRIALALVAVLLCAGVALAAQQVFDSAGIVKRAGGSVQTWYLTGLTGTHSRTSATPVDLQQVQGGDTYLRVNVRGTVPGGTACFVVWTGGTDETLDSIAGIQTATLAVDNPGSAGYQPTIPLYFDVAGARVYDVRCVAVSAGTVDVKAATIGAASFAAE